MYCVGEMLFHMNEHCAKKQFSNHLLVEMVFHMDEFLIGGKEKNEARRAEQYYKGPERGERNGYIVGFTTRRVVRG